MKLDLLRKVVPGVVALGLAGGSVLFASAPAFASTHSHVDAHVAATAAKSKKPVVKAGSACTKAELAKTALVGKSTLVCEKVGKGFKWELKPAAKPVAKKPVAKKAAKAAATKAKK
jgi:hypothetical protein